jgi:Acyltransferase family
MTRHRWPARARRGPHVEPADGPAPPAGGRRPERNRYVDLVRLFSIIVVVVGHWLDTIVVVGLEPVGQSALAVVGYVRWLTLLLQVMPLFFVAGGFAAAASWPSWRARGGRWPGWTHGRLDRLLRPTTWFVAIMACLAALAGALGVTPSVLAQASWAVALHLWFLPVYLLLLVLAVPMLAAWQRAGWGVLAVSVALVAVIDVLVRLCGLTAAGWASFLLAPAAGFLLGIAWHAGALARRVVPIGMVVGGVLVLLVLVAGFGYPPWMIGVPGEPSSNTSPPNLALLAYSAAQIGAVLLLEPPLRRWLQRPRAWYAVARGNGVIMTVYLWHMVPVIVVAAAARAVGLPPGPQPGTPAWWALRVVWIAALGLVLAGVVGLMGRFERPAPPRLGLAGVLAGVLLVTCAALTGFALSRLAVRGFMPSGGLAVGALVAYAAGMVALWLAGRDWSRAPRGTP